jgi:hypothetical protein
VIVNLSHIVEVSTARLNQMSHQEIEETFHRMGAIIQEVPCRGQLPRQTRSTTVSTVPPVVLQLCLDWSFPRYTVVLVTATLPRGFLPNAPSSASSLSSLEDVSARRAFSQRSCTYPCTSTRRARTGTTRTRTWTSTSTSSSSTSNSTGSFLVPWRCSSVS